MPKKKSRKRPLEQTKDVELGDELGMDLPLAHSTDYRGMKKTGEESQKKQAKKEKR